MRAVIPFALFTLFACSQAAAPPASSTQQRDAWDPFTEDPSRILPGASVRLSDLASAADVGNEFGVDDDHVPYPDTYWPFTQGGVDAKWNHSAPSPLEKAMRILAPGQTADAKRWEHDHHGPGVPGVADWWGHCPGWTGAAMFNKPILHAVSVQSSLDPDGNVVACGAGATNCVNFEIGDINALEAEAFVDGDSSFLGARCDTKPADIQRDNFGRIVRNGTGCHGLNAGALLVVLGNRMRRDHLPLAIDAQNDFNTDQIWNQPAYRYRMNAYQPVSKSEAIKLVAGGTPTAGNDYQWNRAAKGFVKIDITLKWVREHGPNRTVFRGQDSTSTTRMVAVIELDADPSDPNANVVGGEYLDDALAGADRLTVPPFVWLIRGPGSDDLDPSVGGNNHNPYVKPSFVQQLVELGSTPL
jgi:hypothetical protein